jgi:outer membrane receptor protein involved in Fe transport
MGLDPAMCSAIANANGFLWRTDPEGWDPHGWFLDPAENIIGSGDNVVDPKLKAAYSDQVILGYERALWPRSSLELSLLYKRTRGLFEDTCATNLPEPAEGSSCDQFDIDEMPYGYYYVEPRGSRKGADYPWFDLQFSKGFSIGATHLDLIVSVLNVFSQERATWVCGLVRGGCGGDFELGEPTTWETPRRWEVRFRVEF